MYKVQNIFLLLFTSLLFLLNIISIKSKEIKIFEGEAFNQELEKTIKTKKKLFLIFFAKNCDYCGYSVRVLKERIVQHYEEDNKISFGVINLDRQSNFWIGYKFNITQIPYILLIEGGKMYQFKEQFDEMKVVQFIDEEKNIEDALDIPEDVGLSKKISFFMAGLIRQTSDLFVKFGFNNNMSNYLACALLFIFLVAMIYLEHKLLNGIRKLIDYFKNWKKNGAKNNNEDIKDEKKNEEGEIKDNQENKPKKE